MSSVIGIDNVTGTSTLVIGYASSFFYMGILTLQTHNYFTRSSNDPRGLKAFVWTLFISELLLSILTVYGFWLGAMANDLLAIFYVHPLGTPTWPVAALAFLTGFVSSITHGFFCWRIWRLERSCLIPIFVMMISSVQFAMVTYGGVNFGLSPSVQLVNYSASSDILSDKFEFYIPVWLCGSLLCDTIITIYMTMILRKKRKDSSFKSTKTLATSLLRLILGTGLITTLATTVELVLATVYWDTVCHLSVFFIVSKLYSNCALVNLNAGKRLRARDDAQSVVIMSTFRVSDPREVANEHVKAVQVFKQVETDVERELVV
ncbi:hypothetical protein BJ138DRAFT_1113257 [Hygrophoropsis aurantiaca]|uniref:Uncharacterized protein n=1 Tax=Hygrophoropsis aurantiaca TaxID=72124 RepID=A0ACB8AF83_9AGAM|nr:hypothetical protein BJ138DRAFT_1113257 [Hygrophoropsis aurantiaca]